MRTKNLTPFLFGTKLTSRRPPQPEMTMVVRGTFKIEPGKPLQVVKDLDQGFLSAERFRDDDDERRGECIYGGDFADFKLHADVLLKGTCHTPGGRPVTECPVRFAVGAWSKSLRVVGPRAWSDALSGAVISSPIPFTQMPLGYTKSFGGPGYALNPVGKGFDTVELPNIEHPSQPIYGREDRPEPAGFGPISPNWPQRAGKVGREYGASYREKRSPYYAEDFDWTHFNAAPLDQQLPGYLRGDEEVTFQNLHPAAPVITTRLPGLRVRAFVKDVEGRFREVHMALDTLFADLDGETLSLTWRGVDPVRETDFLDVATVLIAAERLRDKPFPEKHYQVLLEEFEKDPIGLESEMPEEVRQAVERQRKEEAGEIPKVPPGGVESVSALLQQRAGGSMSPATQQQIAGALVQMKDAGKKAGVDLDAAVAGANSAANDAPPPVVPIKPGVLPDMRLREMMRGMMAQVAEMKKAAAAAAEKGGDAKMLEQVEKLERLPHDPAWKKLDPSYTPPGPVSTDAPGPYRDLSEQDLTGHDLEGVDLRGANLERTILTRANLRGAKLAGANLKNAILYKADLTGADLSRADLTMANFSFASLAGADLREAVVETGFFEDANLRGADLGGAKGEYVVFVRADLTGARAQSAVLDHSDFSSSTLEQADFGGASLVSCLMAECRARQLDLGGAKISGASFADADLSGARLVQTRGLQALFLRTKLDSAELSFSVLPRAHFTECSAIGARFFGANLRECRFYRATLDFAEIVQANLFSADLRKASVTKTKFTGSSLYDAKFLEASGAGCDFTDANLKRSTLESV